MDLHRRKEFGHLVRNLRIDMDYNSQFVVNLPAVFPHVKCLDWSEEELFKRDMYPSNTTLDKPLFNEMVKNWVGLENINNYSGCGNQHIYWKQQNVII